MKVILAGMNIDASLLSLIRSALLDEEPRAREELIRLLKAGALTPETLSAAYARISRSPVSVEDLRKAAVEEVEKARRSNEKIIYGMGHGSIAEHAVFNFDILGISRLASEWLQEHRLVSFTEKSQRYIKLDKDYIVPDEIKDDKELTREFNERLSRGAFLYNKYYTAIMNYLKEHEPHLSERDRSGKAKEDARYILSLATTSQMGMTVNARNLEYILRKLAASPRFELQKLGEMLYRLVRDIVPSLVVFHEPGEYDLKPWKGRFSVKAERLEPGPETVRLISRTNDGEDKVIAGLIFQDSPYDYQSVLDHLTSVDKKGIVKEVMKGINFYDSVDRAFELASATFEVLVSASCYAQLKRHRMMSRLAGSYAPDLGVTVPDSIKAIGEEESFLEEVEKVNEFYDKVKIYDRNGADYVLTNAHRRKVTVKANLREWYHFVRLRSDIHAQWEIRALSERIRSKLNEAYPLLTGLLLGKDDFMRLKTEKKGE
ncbi:MAG TPA: FAD-dependent thymidylate synthase [Firmicutes bacterium]|nr:FAD-dependent thymidylate synthase [Bacillota bacterium]